MLKSIRSIAPRCAFGDVCAKQRIDVLGHLSLYPNPSACVPAPSRKHKISRAVTGRFKHLLAFTTEGDVGSCKSALQAVCALRGCLTGAPLGIRPFDVMRQRRRLQAYTAAAIFSWHIMAATARKSAVAPWRYNSARHAGVAERINAAPSGVWCIFYGHGTIPGAGGRPRAVVTCGCTAMREIMFTSRLLVTHALCRGELGDAATSCTGVTVWCMPRDACGGDGRRLRRRRDARTATRASRRKTSSLTPL